MQEYLVKIEPLSFTTIESRIYKEYIGLNKPINSVLAGLTATAIVSIPMTLICGCFFSFTSFMITLGITFLTTFISTFFIMRHRQKKILNNPDDYFHYLLRQSVLWFNDRVAHYNRYLLECTMDDDMKFSDLRIIQANLLAIRKELKAKIQTLAPHQIPQAPCIQPLLCSMQRLREYEYSLPASERIKLLPQGELDASIEEIDQLLT